MKMRMKKGLRKAPKKAQMTRPAPSLVLLREAGAEAVVVVEVPGQPVAVELLEEDVLPQLRRGVGEAEVGAAQNRQTFGGALGRNELPTDANYRQNWVVPNQVSFLVHSG